MSNKVMNLFRNEVLFATLTLILFGAGCSPSKEKSSTEASNTSAAENPRTELTSQESSSAWTYHRDIAPILNANCVECHRPGQSGPFLLMTYNQVRRRGKQIVEVIESGFMPPWLPAKTEYPLKGARSLTGKEISIIKEWVAAGAPEGEEVTSSTTREWPEGWQIREPDLVIEMKEAFEVPAGGPDVYRNFVIPIPIEESKFVRGMEFQPENYTVAHHALLRIDTSGAAFQLDQETPGYGFDGMDTPTGVRAPYG